MERKSQVQIPKDLLLALFQYHLAGNEEYLPEIEKALMEKLDSIWTSVECMRTFVGKDSA